METIDPAKGDRQNADVFADGALKRIVSVATALGFGTALGSLACLGRGATHGFDFQWRWRALLWAAVGAAAGANFWRLAWRAERKATPKARARFVRYSVLMLIGAFAAFAYPMRFIADEHRGDVYFGLALAIAVLTCLGLLVFRVAKWFTDNDALNKTE